ncbi:uncharacterized protein LOC117328484 [Pecten maximus]|uniref:uncharacterized protein LOC117328484 n=1 Tax=Pecten maximus TaxID=6579 RepID=UPI001458AEC9|nr:uncharacterized protein LOC117328484 [Pecten maximus]
MGKRKQGAPQRASADKRRCLEWNMLDGVNPEGSLIVLDDNDPCILNEAQQVQGSTPETKATETYNPQQPQFSTLQMREMFDANMKYCSYSIRVMSSLPFRETEWHTELGVFSVKLLPMSEAAECLPSGHDEIWLYVSEVTGKSMLYIEEDENEENLSKTKTLNFWCVDIDIPIDVSIPVLYNYFKYTAFYEDSLESYWTPFSSSCFRDSSTQNWSQDKFFNILFFKLAFFGSIYKYPF